MGFREVPNIFQECFEEVLRVFRGSFREISKVFKKIVKGTSTKMEGHFKLF